MKTYMKLLSGVVAAFLLSVCLTGCKDYEIPEANTQLSYPAGEMALGAGSFVSARPSVLAAAPAFAIAGITHNGATVDNAMASIDATTGVITITPGSDITAVGEYLVSVNVAESGRTTTYANAFQLMVKGLAFETPEAATTRGEQLTVKIKAAYLVQQQGTEYSLVAPDPDPEQDYKHISVNAETCAVTIAATAEAGVYPISIKVKNRTNPTGTIFKDVLTITVESKPYNLTYTPSSVTLILKEGHTSPAPKLRAATEAEGKEVTFALADDYDAFTIDAATGAISLPEGLTLADNTLKTYELDIKATNSIGSTLFTRAYAVSVDPSKTPDPITAVTYAEVFPVTLAAGQAWTSSQPALTGSNIGLQFSLIDAPQGVTIDPKTGVITMAENHRMPLKADNKLTIRAINVAMETPLEIELGDFNVTKPTAMWAPQYHAIVGSANAVTDSGIDNMDRISFSAHIQNNQNTNIPASHYMVRNAFGRTWDNGPKVFLDAVDFTNSNQNNTWAGNTSQNNDWLVSGEVTLPAADASFLEPYVMIDLAGQYASAANLHFEVWVVEINATNVYTKGNEGQDDKGMDAKPCDLPWTILAATDKTKAPMELKLATTLSGTPVTNAINVSQFAGKKFRFALRCWNPTDVAASNGRTYRVSNMKVEMDLPQE